MSSTSPPKSQLIIDFPANADHLFEEKLKAVNWMTLPEVGNRCYRLLCSAPIEYAQFERSPSITSTPVYYVFISFYCTDCFQENLGRDPEVLSRTIPIEEYLIRRADVLLCRD